MVEYSALSSAYMETLLCNTVFAASSMYTRKKNGPNTEPWGTTETTGKGSDCVPPNTTNCVLLDR